MFSLDPVGHFHLRNGACVHRLNWLANNSGKPLFISWGLCVELSLGNDHHSDLLISCPST